MIGNVSPYFKPSHQITEIVRRAFVMAHGQRGISAGS